MQACYCCEEPAEPGDVCFVNERFFHKKCAEETAKHRARSTGSTGSEVTVSYRKVKLTHRTYCSDADIEVPNLNELAEGSYIVEVPEESDDPNHHIGRVMPFNLETLEELDLSEDEEPNIVIATIKRRYPWTGQISDYEIEREFCHVEASSGYCGGKFGTFYTILSYIVD